MDYSKIIMIEPGKMGRKLCIRGLRITVYDVLDYLASGMTEDEILHDFPDLTGDDLRACLAFAADREAKTRQLPRVKPLFDENLSPVLSASLTDCYRESPHVSRRRTEGVPRRRCLGVRSPQR